VVSAWPELRSATPAGASDGMEALALGGGTTELGSEFPSTSCWAARVIRAASLFQSKAGLCTVPFSWFGYRLSNLIDKRAVSA
jgi:hypothetical protein